MEKVISNDGTSIAYHKTGQGPSLILVDGAMCNSTFGPMPKLVPLVSDNFSVISYDRRGRGDSTDQKPYSPEREIEDIRAIIDMADGPVHLFGMSSGAMLALMAAANDQRIRKLVLYEPPFESEENESSRGSEIYYSTISDLLTADDQSGAVKYFLREITQLPYGLVTIMSFLPMWKNLKANVISLPYDLEITRSFSLQKLESRAISTPALVVSGDKSLEKLKCAAKEAAERLQNSSIRVLEGQTHNVSMKVLAPVLTDFLLHN